MSTSELGQILASAADQASAKGDSKRCVELIEKLYALLDGDMTVVTNATRH